jgi:hypothetical protein
VGRSSFAPARTDAQWSALGAVEGEVGAVKLAGVALDVDTPVESLVVTMPGPLG